MQIDSILEKILTLKDSIWNFGIKSQKRWFDKNIKDNDIHNILLINNNIIGYTLLANRHFTKFINKQPINEKSYILFATLILKKKYRNISYASHMMHFNNKYILSQKKPAFLLCHKKKLNFYKFFGWSRLKKKNFSIKDHKHSLEAMTYNLKKYKKNKEKFYNFFYYR